jgi:hypothetical protein
LLDTFNKDSEDKGGKWGGYTLTRLPSGTVYSVDSYGLYQWNGDQWVGRYDNINATTAIFGTADNNLFLTGDHGLLVHYNGVNWFTYANLAQQNVIYSGGWADENQAFVLGWVDGWKTILLRGR